MATIFSYSFDEYVDLVKSFHGHVAPGVAIGGFMVDLAFKTLPAGIRFQALCETPKCLPDAVQLLTSCTAGNGRLKIVNFGRYALTLYENQAGKGVRVSVSPKKLEPWSEIQTWFYKRKPKKDQGFDLLMSQVRKAESTLFDVQKVRVAQSFTTTKRRGAFAICPRCHESYPADDGEICLGCKDEATYGTGKA